MSEIDVVRTAARKALRVTTIGDSEDNQLWDRAQRIVRNVEQICRLEELARANVPIDRYCLVGAAYFSDAGLVKNHVGKNTSIPVTFADVTNGELREYSTQVVTEQLTGILPVTKIEKINRIITASADRNTEMIEAMILSDARNLDDMGAVGIYNEFRRYVAQGKGVTEALESWNRKVEYQYWQARLKESFRFEAVRAAAQRRYEATEYFMNQLGIENAAQDLEDTLIEAVG